MEVQDILEDVPGRIAKFRKINNMTTNLNSLKQSNKLNFVNSLCLKSFDNCIFLFPENGRELPVSHNGKDDDMWMHEKERVLGLPDHYTDYCNLPKTKRQILIGRAWSIPCIKDIIKDLSKIFLNKNDQC